MAFHKRGLVVALLVLVVGCAGDPEILDLDAAAARGYESLPRESWEGAPAGCEDADLARLELFACEGESLLGALVEPGGEVVCVDAMSVLLSEIAELEPSGSDPNPQPSEPITSPFTTARRVATSSSEPVATSSGGGAEADPTPTPAIERDPTPTPAIVGGVEVGDTLVFPFGDEPEEEDPTPTPAMES